MATESASRNIANVKELDAWMESLIQVKLGMPDQRDPREAAAASWAASVGRRAIMREGQIQDHAMEDMASQPAWIQKAMEEGKPVHDLTLGDEDRVKLERAIDWLRSESGPPIASDWTRVSMQQALEAERAWIEQMAAQAEGEEAQRKAAEGEKVALRLDPTEHEPGWVWMELESEEALILEGARMSHCVGSIYPRKVRSGQARVFSLRDQSGEPMATLSVIGGRFAELKAKANQRPGSEVSQAAKPLMRSVIKEMRMKKLAVSASDDFKQTGFASSTIFGFGEMGKELGETERAMVDRWMLLFGDQKEALKKEMAMAAKAGAMELFDRLAKGELDWMKEPEIVLEVWGNPAMIERLDEWIDHQQERKKEKGWKQPLARQWVQIWERIVAKAIESQSERMIDALEQANFPGQALLEGLSKAAQDGVSRAAMEMALERMIEKGMITAKESPAAMKKTCAELARIGSIKGIESLGKVWPSEELPWGEIARLAAESGKYAMLDWALDRAPQAQSGSLGAALAAAAQGPQKMWERISKDPRAQAGLDWAIRDAVRTSHRSEPLERCSALAKSIGVEPRIWAKWMGEAMAKAWLGRPQAAAWIAEKQIETEPDPKRRESLLWGLVSNGGAHWRELGAPKPEGEHQEWRAKAREEQIEALERLEKVCQRDLSAHLLVRMAVDCAMEGAEEAALRFLRHAKAKPDFHMQEEYRMDLLKAVASRGGERLFDELEGSLKDLERMGMTVEKALGQGNWRFAMMLQEQGKAADAETLKDALILAAASAPMEGIQAMAKMCDPKRKGSQALVEAVRAGRRDVVEFLAPMSDPKAMRSEALRSAAARGDEEMVAFLMPMSDPRDDDSAALRDALGAGHWEVAKMLWPASDPNAGAGLPLALAARDADVERMRWMIERGADPSAGGCRPLRALLKEAGKHASQEAFELIWEASDKTRVEHEDAMLALKANRPKWLESMLPFVDVSAKRCALLKEAARMGELELMELLIPASDPWMAEQIIKKEGFEDEAEKMLLGMIKSEPKKAGPGV